MNVTYRIDKDIIYIAVEGRIDASNAAEAEEKILGIKNDNPRIFLPFRVYSRRNPSLPDGQARNNQ